MIKYLPSLLLPSVACEPQRRFRHPERERGKEERGQSQRHPSVSPVGEEVDDGGGPDVAKHPEGEARTYADDYTPAAAEDLEKLVISACRILLFGNGYIHNVLPQRTKKILCVLCLHD